MDLLLPAFVAFVVLYLLRVHEQTQRIRLLAAHLGRYRIEKLMEQLTHNYLRALDEEEPVRRGQILELQHDTERELAGQIGKLAQDFQRVSTEDARVSRMAWPLPFATRLWPANSFDMRALLAVHADGIQACAANTSGLSPRDQAFRMTAELFLLQHSCHWFCKSRSIASARMVARHKTSHEQALQAVSPDTRRAYLQVTQGHAGGR
ncbi:MAG: hypothetical protein GAK30_03329 [Paracidovorax wautersii]|uniref:Uncharacterized protein n=1 Tax=Paracidovorax wautersii TaxID=1177982 RepID=A0A7V8FLF7_9BURK|nr:MAG: hypothetical protein GAK30_03329 [Paracidovorax wautersii]